MAQRRSRVCHWCSYHILKSSVIYYWTDARQHGIYLFYINTQITTHKAFVYFKILQHNAKASLCPLWRIRKKPFDVIYCLYKMKQFHWLLCVAKNCYWSRKIPPSVSNLTRASLFVEWKLTAKAELNFEIYKSWRKYWKNQVSFCHRSNPVSRKAWTLPWKLQELKNYARKTCGCGQPGGHLIRVLNERSVTSGGDFCGWWFSNQLDIVSETHFSCDTVGRELWLAILSSLLCLETDKNIRIGKQGYVFILSDFKKWAVDVSFLTSISVSTVILTLG